VSATAVDISAEVIDVAVRHGALGGWAKVTAFESGRFVRLERLDTDHKELDIRVKDVRAAIRRVARLDLDRLGIEPIEKAEITAAVNGETSVTPNIADLLIQIAATGRAQY
jgi:hypothetical protein